MLGMVLETRTEMEQTNAIKLLNKLAVETEGKLLMQVGHFMLISLFVSYIFSIFRIRYFTSSSKISSSISIINKNSIIIDVAPVWLVWQYLYF